MGLKRQSGSADKKETDTLEEPEMPTCTHPDAYADDTDELICVKCGEAVDDDGHTGWSDQGDELGTVKAHSTTYSSAGQPVNRYYHSDTDDLLSKLERAPWFIAAPVAIALLLGGTLLLLWLLSAS